MVTKVCLILKCLVFFHSVFFVDWHLLRTISSNIDIYSVLVRWYLGGGQGKQSFLNYSDKLSLFSQMILWWLEEASWWALCVASSELRLCYLNSTFLGYTVTRIKLCTVCCKFWSQSAVNITKKSCSIRKHKKIYIIAAKLIPIQP